MIVRMVSALVVVCSLLAPTFPVIAQETSGSNKLLALEKIIEASKTICTDVPVSGSTTSVQLEGDAQAEFFALLKALADLGIEGAAKYTDVEYSGVLQSELAKQIQNTNECRLSVLNLLSNALLENQETPESTPSESTTIVQEFGSHSFAEVMEGLAGRWNGRVDCSSTYLPWFTFTASYEESSSVLLSGQLTVTGEATSRFATQVGEALPSTLTLMSDVGERPQIRISGQSRGTAGRLLDMIAEATSGGVFRGVLGSDSACSVVLSKG